MHDRIKKPPVKERVRDTHGHAAMSLTRRNRTVRLVATTLGAAAATIARRIGVHH